MDINTHTYYICNSNIKYNFLGVKESNRSISDLQKIILYTPNFCRENQSISTSELKSYIVSGITFFTRNVLNQITGLINFDINQSVLNILGICVPGLSKGIGTYLINLVKKFAKANNICLIKLTCYNNLKYFYLKQQFKVVEESTFYDSDEDSDEEEKKTRFKMEFDMSHFIGGKTRRRKKTFRNIPKKLKSLKNKKKTLKKH